MLGLGETMEEVLQVMRDLRAHQVSILTLGQYLRPSPKHLPIVRYVTPREFGVGLFFPPMRAAGSALMLFHYHEKPSIMRGGKLANFTLVCGIQFFIIDVRAIAWPVYGVGATLYVVSGFRYIWRELLRWKRARPTSAAVS